MDQYLNNRQNEILWNLLANPADNGHLYADNLQRLVDEFPQSGLLHALLSHARSGQNISHAAVYLNPRALYVIVNSPESLPVLADSQIIQQLGDHINYAAVEDIDLSNREGEGSEPDEFNNESGTIVDGAEHMPPAIDAWQNSVETEADTEGVDTVESSVEENKEGGDSAEDIHENESMDETISFEQVQDNIAEEQEELSTDERSATAVPPEEENAPDTPAENIREDELVTEAPSFELAESPRGIDDDVYDEIVGIEDISFTQVAKPVDEVAPPEEIPVVDEEALPEATTDSPATEPAVQRERMLNMDDEAEKLIVGNIAATDYFVFDRAINERRQAEAAEKESFIQAQHAGNENANSETTLTEENKEVSKYNDDTMPYTFMWWLNKTRKEHAGIYQPFKLDTTQAIRQAGADELQQQYYENIFHLNSVEELDRSTPQHPIEFDPKSKEDRIIKRFIVEEPHITTPSGDKLDNENKARKSAEDQDELVTETLAHIYIDQMLYHKAINTYRKLMLKFPEKSRYFADQIEQLERKTN